MFLRSLNVRLAALFSTVFLVCSLLLFGITYGLLSGSLGRKQDRAIGSLMLELWALYQLGGLELFVEEMPADSVEQFFVRIADADRQTVLFYLPGSWTERAEELADSLSVLETERSTRLKEESIGVSLKVTSLLLPDDNLLQVGLSIEDDLQLLSRFRRIYAVVVVPLLLLSFIGGLVFSLRSLRPIHELTQITRGIIDTGRVDSRLPPRGTGDELDTLVQLFNRMLGRIESLIRGLRDSLDSVAHDLRTPMTRLVGKAEMALKNGGGTEELRGVLNGCIDEARDMLAMLDVLLDISEAEIGAMRLHREPTDISRLLRDMVDLYQYAGEEKGIRITAELPESIIASVDPHRLRQVVTNLLDNAVKYTGAGGVVTVRAAREAGSTAIRIVDAGIGFPPADADRIWERYFRSDRSRSEPGRGLGLSLVKAVIEAHGGSVRATSGPGKGSEFLLRIPLSDIT